MWLLTSARPYVRLLLTACAVAASIALVGCQKSGGGISEEQAKKFEAGPPKEMPSEGKALMAKMAKEGKGAPKGAAGPTTR